MDADGGDVRDWHSEAPDQQSAHNDWAREEYALLPFSLLIHLFWKCTASSLLASPTAL
jgi:hypothetical protein